MFLPDGGTLKTDERIWVRIRLRKSDLIRVAAEHLRGRLFKLVDRKRISREQAEALAEDLLIGPLVVGRMAGRPFAPDDDPLAADWSIPMALGWIMTRKDEAVLYFSTERVETLLELSTDEVRSRFGTIVTAYNDAQNELWQNLRMKTFRADGIPLSGGLRQKIKPRRWKDLKLYGQESEVVVMDGHISNSSRLGTTGFSKVAVPSQQIRSIWKTANTEQPKRRGPCITYIYWPEFEAEARRRHQDRNGFSDDWKLADLEEEMRRWCDAHDDWPKTPSETWIRNRIKRAIKHGGAKPPDSNSD